MMRSFRHDGISNIQSVRERDRQRELQKQERAQMLSNDEKDISTNIHLFHAPVKVDPSTEDLEIQNTLGNFEHVRHYVLDSSSNRGIAQSLIGVDQNSKPLIHPSHPHLTRHPGAVSSSGATGPINVKNPSKVPPNPVRLPPHVNPVGSNSGANSSAASESVPGKNNTHSHSRGPAKSVSEPVGPPVSFKPEKAPSNDIDSVTANESNDKNSRKPFKKPALDRADSQLELESILKEMMDVKTPLTAIQTPVKESSIKKIHTPRRVSNSEDIVKTIHEGMTNIPKPIQKMDSSESSSSDTSDSGSESEDSSSGSQGGIETGNSGVILGPSTPPQSWDLSSFLVKQDSNVKSADSSGTGGSKDEKSSTSRANGSGESPGDGRVKMESVVTSTSLSGSCSAESSSSKSSQKSSSNLPHTNQPDVNESQYPKVPGKSPRKAVDNRQDVYHGKPPVAPRKGGPSSGPKGRSLSASSSDDEDVKKRSEVSRSEGEKRLARKSMGKRSRHSSSSSERNGPKSDEEDSSPEADNANVDRKKNDTIRKLFCPNTNKKVKLDSPSVESEGGRSSAGSNPTSSTRGKGSKAATPRRVSGKDSGRKPNESASTGVHNGDVDSKSLVKSNASSSGADKKRDSSAKEIHSSHHHGGRKHKSQSITGFSSHKGLDGSGVSHPNPSIVVVSRTKDELSGKSQPASLMCRILLSKLSRAPGPLSVSSVTNTSIPDKDTDKGGGAGHLLSENSHRMKLHYEPGRVGSSSDHPSGSPHDTFGGRHRDDPACSDSERLSPKIHSHRKLKKKARSPKKSSKIKRESNFETRLEEDSRVVIGEASSNTNDFVSDSTLRTPPVDSDVVAPDSSLNPPHLPSPAVPQQPVYFSYFERNDTPYDEYCSRDQETYLEEAKRLKHKADNEKVSTTQASTYLEAGLYFILTGLSMERDRAVGSQSAYTMYKDTLSLIRYIANRFRSGRSDYSNTLEAKIIVLSMRCQSLLSLKLFKIKMRETKEILQYLQEHFAKAPPETAPIPNSPQLSTPSPHSPTSSPAGPGGLIAHTPSPHPHQNHHVATIPRSIYAQMSKQCTNTMNLITAHELWESADNLVERYRMEEFFIAADRLHGPLTLHNTLVDLVRYVKHCLTTLKINSEIS